MVYAAACEEEGEEGGGPVGRGGGGEEVEGCAGEEVGGEGVERLGVRRWHPAPAPASHGNQQTTPVYIP